LGPQPHMLLQPQQQQPQQQPQLPNSNIVAPPAPASLIQNLQAQSASSPATVAANLLKSCNRVTDEIRNKVVAFLSGNHHHGGIATEELLLNEEVVKAQHESAQEDGSTELQQIYLLLDYKSGTWKKFLKRISQ